MAVPFEQPRHDPSARDEAVGATARGAHAESLSVHDGANNSQEEGVDLAPLLRAAAGGDPGAWRAIVDLYARRVYALARSRLGPIGGTSGGQAASARAATGSGEGGGGSGRGSVGHAAPIAQIGQGGGDDDAEEITQSVFVTVATKLASGDYDEVGRFEAWLFRIAMNRIRDEARRRKRHARPTDPVVMSGVQGRGGGASADGAGPLDVAADRASALDALRTAMQELPESDREVVELRHHAGMSFREIADVLDEPLGTLLARHHRALRKLKELLPPGIRAAFEGEGSDDPAAVPDDERPANRPSIRVSENHMKDSRNARTSTGGRSAHQTGGRS